MIVLGESVIAVALYRIRLKSSRNIMQPAATNGSW
jgi:hypothetical protein